MLLAQDDPSTPLRLTKELEDFSLDSDPDSEPEGLVDDPVNSDIDIEHVTIDFPRFHGASMKIMQKDTSGPSLYSYKDNGRSPTSGPSIGSYEPPHMKGSRDSRSVENFISDAEWHAESRKGSGSLQAGMNSLKKESDVLSDSSTTANGYVGGKPINGTTATNKTTQC